MTDLILLYRKCIDTSIDALADKIRCLASTLTKDPLISFRIKNPETLRKKMLRKKTEDVFLIHDVYGIRIIVESVDVLYSVLEKIKEEFPAYLANDFIKNPLVLSDPGFEGKCFRCLRIVAYENKVPFEIQITTSEFHIINESHHDVYHRKLYS